MLNNAAHKRPHGCAVLQHAAQCVTAFLQHLYSMASIIKRGDSWQVFVTRKGVRKSATFKVKAQATAWAIQFENEILAEKAGQLPKKTFAEVLERYRDEVSATKKGERWEVIRINRLLQDPICQIKVSDLRAPHFSQWRDKRLTEVSPATVRREWNQLSSICNYARKEWQWMSSNPMSDLQRPPEPKHRERILSQDEIDRLCVALNYTQGIRPAWIGSRVGAAMMFAIETGMRAGEIAALEWSQVFLDKSYLTVRDGKTAAAARHVPLSQTAISILKQLGTEGSVFALTPRQIDANFRKGKALTNITDLHFHDTRHTAITRLAKKLPILDLARMVGHRDLKMLMVYYNESATDIAGRLG